MILSTQHPGIITITRLINVVIAVLGYQYNSRVRGQVLACGLPRGSIGGEDGCSPAMRNTLNKNVMTFYSMPPPHHPSRTHLADNGIQLRTLQRALLRTENK